MSGKYLPDTGIVVGLFCTQAARGYALPEPPGGYIIKRSGSSSSCLK
jgi:hypothetical protein